MLRSYRDGPESLDKVQNVLAPFKENLQVFYDVARVLLSQFASSALHDVDAVGEDVERTGVLAVDLLGEVGIVRVFGVDVDDHGVGLVFDKVTDDLPDVV